MRMSAQLKQADYEFLLLVLAEWWGGTPLFRGMASEILFGKPGPDTIVFPEVVYPV